MLTGKVSIVKVGMISFEGILVDNGKYAVTVQQTAELFCLSKSHASRDIKRLLGNEYNFIRIFIENNGNNRSENLAMYLPDFETAAQMLAISGNINAIKFLGLYNKTVISKKNKTGHIYLIQNSNTSNVKIGFATNPCNRLRTLQTATDCELILLKTIDGTIKKEKLLHKKFKSYLIRNEWFLFSDEIKLHFGLVNELVCSNK